MISGVFGLPGAGKSVFLAKAVERALVGKPLMVGDHMLHDGKYDTILTNFPMRGCCRLDFESLGKVDYHNCLFLCDEISLLADARNFKTFSDDAKFFFSQHRKGGNTFIWCSQSWSDVDKRIRNITDAYYYIRPAGFFPNYFSMVIPIDPYFEVKNMENGFEFAPPLKRSLLFLPKYWKLFDSYAYINAKELAEFKSEFWEVGEMNGKSI